MLSSSDIYIQAEEFTHLIGIMVDFQPEREECQDNNGNGIWDEGEGEKWEIARRHPHRSHILAVLAAGQTRISSATENIHSPSRNM